MGEMGSPHMGKRGCWDCFLCFFKHFFSLSLNVAPPLFATCQQLNSQKQRRPSFWTCGRNGVATYGKKGVVGVLTQKKNLISDIWEKWGRHTWGKGVLEIKKRKLRASTEAPALTFQTETGGACAVGTRRAVRVARRRRRRRPPRSAAPRTSATASSRWQSSGWA